MASAWEQFWNVHTWICLLIFGNNLAFVVHREWENPKLVVEWPHLSLTFWIPSYASLKHRSTFQSSTKICYLKCGHFRISVGNFLDNGFNRCPMNCELSVWWCVANHMLMVDELCPFCCQHGYAIETWEDDLFCVLFHYWGNWKIREVWNVILWNRILNSRFSSEVL